MREEVLRMDHVTRVVDGSACLTDLSLHLFCGEILGLLCMSDHGEDELVELVQKNLPLHYGFVYFDEQLVNSYRKSPMTRNRAAVIERRGRLVGGLSVMDNLFVLRRGFKKYLISRRTLREQYWRYAGELEIEVSPDTPASALSGYERCAVELLKAVLSGARLVVVRDISNIISTADLARFQALMRRCAARGLSFLYLCAHHEEAFTICDRIMVMEDGQIVLALRRPYTSDEAIWRHSLDFSRPVPLPELTGPRRLPALEFDRVVTENLHGFSMRVLPGECVALLDRSNTILEDIVGLMTGNLRPRGGRLVMGGRPFSGGDGMRGQAVGVIQADPTRTMIFEGLTSGNFFGAAMRRARASHANTRPCLERIFMSATCGAFRAGRFTTLYITACICTGRRSYSAYSRSSGRICTGAATSSTCWNCCARGGSRWCF